MTELISPSAAAGYVFVEMFVTDREAMRRYAAASGPAVTASGGEYLALGEPTGLEGAGIPSRAALIRFPAPEAAEAFYRSQAYREARELRRDAATCRILLIPGR